MRPPLSIKLFLIRIAMLASRASIVLYFYKRSHGSVPTEHLLSRSSLSTCLFKARRGEKTLYYKRECFCYEKIIWGKDTTKLLRKEVRFGRRQQYWFGRFSTGVVKRAAVLTRANKQGHEPQKLQAPYQRDHAGESKASAFACYDREQIPAGEDRIWRQLHPQDQTDPRTYQVGLKLHVPSSPRVCSWPAES